MKWIERSQINSFDFTHLTKRISNRSLPTKIKEEIIAQAIKETQSNSLHFVVNFILEPEINVGK